MRTAVTDAGLRHLVNVGNVEGLGMSGSSYVTDAAVDYLVGFDRLRHIWLVGTQITAAGKARLRAAYPMATIGP
ncbi:MAG: hypothetical protein ACOC6F_03700 [bacterium]